MTPDWSDDPEPVPYADLDNPQSLNLYAYAGNNPVSRVDKDGHCYPLCTVLAGAAVGAVFSAGTEIVSEWANNKPTDWNKIGNAAAAGAMAGAVAGLAGPEAGLLAKVGASAAAGVVGGVVERAGDGESSTFGQVAADAVIGAAGTAASKLPSENVASRGVAKAAEQTIDKGTDVINAVIDGTGGNQDRTHVPQGSQQPLPAAKATVTSPANPPLNCQGPALGGEADCAK